MGEAVLVLHAESAVCGTGVRAAEIEEIVHLLHGIGNARAGRDVESSMGLTIPRRG
jgi:hypothetical protein